MERPGTLTKPSFDCAKCPGFCCSYDVINVLEQEAQRISAHLNISLEDFILKHTKYGQFKGDSRYPLMMKHKRDKHFGTICNFFDDQTRRCRIYEVRPETCRRYPHGDTCGYYQFLTFERDLQSDDTHIAVTS